MNARNDEQFRVSTRVWRAALAFGVAALLMTGAAWHGLAADSHAKPVQAAAQQESAPSASVVSRAALGGRDSYADIVKIVAPAVVTVRTEGKMKLATTGRWSEATPQFGMART